MIPPEKTALIVGASGLVGSFCLRLLLQHERYTKVIAIGRKPLPMQHPRLRQLVVDFDNLDIYKHSLIADDIYCTLGTTIKQAGSRENFYRVDYTYVVQLAHITAANKANQFLVVSALGASAQSRVFYSRVKGQMEAAIKELSFPGIHIFQPSLLLGPRPQKRRGETIAAVLMRNLSFLLVGPLQKYQAVAAEDVAKAMLFSAMQESTGLMVHNSVQIKSEAALLPSRIKN
jgi:uncharacterized protein YbjT (DUF2867 family)